MWKIKQGSVWFNVSGKWIEDGVLRFTQPDVYAECVARMVL